ncbi:helix-turn-helix transcriptional regulator [Patulibacter minatonensis]|uniref:helix-turn-helix transcriptional regulator n=1 Tax=Patulibacter minatonensis TaxID=298163 RepID=UPI00047DEEB2|nr:LuxR family transcriptional regulator [Patulibacter minatonensis]
MADPPSPPRLLERGPELDLLDGAVDRAAAGRPGLILIEGPGGIGKTRLLTAARDRAIAAGMLVLEARGSEREHRLPFGVVDQLFPDRRDARSGPTAADPGDESFVVLASLFRETEALAVQRPVMLLIDDLHLCDEPSLLFLGYLTRRLGRLRASVLATLRPFERSASAALLGELVGDPLTTSVRPAALSDAATAELLEGALDQDADATFAAACREATGGNPLLLGELVKTLRSEAVSPVARELDAVNALGPRAVLRTVLVRLAGLPAGATELARALAVLGKTADLSLAAALAGLDPDAAGAAATALIGAEILADQAGTTFVHPLVESAIYEDLPAPQRSLTHGAAADLLRDRGRSANAIAAHLVLAPPDGRAGSCDVLAEAARASLHAGAPADAALFLRRAIAEPPPEDRRAEFAAALARATMLVDGPAAELDLREALRLTDDPAERVSLLIDLARLLMFIDRVDESVPLLEQAAAELPPGAEDLGRIVATTTLMAPLFDPTVTPPADVVALGRRLPLQPGIGAKMLAAQSARNWAFDGGAADDCAALALAALDGGDLVRADSVFLAVSAVFVLEIADRPEADAGWAAIERECELHGSHQARVALSLFRGYGLVRRGELAAADAALDDALEAARDWNAVQGGVHAAAFRARVRIERDDLAGAREALESVPAPDRQTDEARMWLDSRVALLNAESRHDEALAAAAELERRFAFLPHLLDTPALAHRAVALHGLGRDAEALVAAQGALAQARTWGSPGLVGQALRILGSIEVGAAGGTGIAGAGTVKASDGGSAEASEGGSAETAEPGIPRLRQAVATTDGTRARLEHARAQVELGAALRAADATADARLALRAGLELAARLGAGVLEARARRELYAAGGRPRTTALTGPGSLTEAERRVVELAADGLTNRAIGEALFVTRKTVELHLSNAYRKLGVAGRGGLAGALRA